MRARDKGGKKGRRRGGGESQMANVKIVCGEIRKNGTRRDTRRKWDSNINLQ